MKLRLDTHIWVWSVLDRARLSSRVIAELESPSNEKWLSPVSLCANWITHTLITIPMREAQVTYQVAQETGHVRLPHRDPADRFLVATARVFDLTLVTADEHLLKARQVPVLANR
jgi:PIN domain nuclease of toxin-antitoxin system